MGCDSAQLLVQQKHDPMPDIIAGLHLRTVLNHLETVVLIHPINQDQMIVHDHEGHVSIVGHVDVIPL